MTVLDNLTTGARKSLEALPVKFVRGDIEDADLMNEVVLGHHGVVHLAAQTGVPSSLADPRRDCEVNVIGTLNLLEACRASKQQMSFVFASSSAPLGRQTPPATEDKAPLPVSPYGASKLAGEGYCLAYFGSWGLRTVVLRFANVYGPHSNHKESVVAKFFKDVSEKGVITIQGDGQQTRDLLHVKDLCRAILMALEIDIGGEVLHIATGTETSILEVAGMVRDVTGGRVDIQHAPARQGDVRRSYASIARARRVLGWQPRIGLRDGLRDTLAHFVSSAPYSTTRSR